MIRVKNLSLLLLPVNDGGTDYILPKANSTTQKNSTIIYLYQNSTHVFLHY